MKVFKLDLNVPAESNSFSKLDYLFSAAFDLVDHKALIFKFRQSGVGGPFLGILTEFSSNRLQMVIVNGQSNEHRNVICSVPHGSILDPLLFILYTHD